MRECIVAIVVISLISFLHVISYADARENRPDILGIPLGMDLELAKKRGKKFTKSGLCKRSAMDQYGVAELTCGALKMMIVNDALGKPRVASITFSGFGGAAFSKYWRDLERKNGAPCANSRSFDGAVYDLWGFLEDGTKVNADGPGCYPYSREKMEDEADGEALGTLRCHTNDRGSYIVLEDMTHYARNEDDLGWRIHAISCALMAEANARKAQYENLEK